MARITILGIGAMGSRMAKTLLKAGHEVTVWNRSQDKIAPLIALGARAAISPRAAVATADFAIAMVRDDDASRQVWLSQDTGALVNMPKGAVVIESSTVTIAWARELNQACSAHEIAFLDAPVAGSRPQAEDAQLIYFVGGDAAVVARAEPILKTMGSIVHHAGAAGSGAAVKLVVNALLGVQLAAMAELIGFMRRCGLDVAKVIEIMSATPVCSRATKFAADAMLARNFTPLFPIELVEKDFGYVLETAAVNNARVPMVQAARQVCAQALEYGYGGDNITGLVQLYEGKAPISSYG